MWTERRLSSGHIWSADTRRLVWIPQVPWDQTTHPKIAMPMTAASVAQRRMGFKALRAQEMPRSVALPGFPGIQQAGSDE